MQGWEFVGEIFGGIKSTYYFSGMKESVKIEKAVVEKVRRHTKKTRQTIGGFFELAAFQSMGDKTITEWEKKAAKWDALEGKISEFYREEESKEGDLLDIGEAAATAFGYL